MGDARDDGATIKAASYLQASVLQQRTPTQHAFSTRHGGVSTGCYATLNLAAHLTDETAAVQENRRRLLTSIDRSPGSWTQTTQVHGNHVLEVSKNAPAQEPADALVTQDPAITLAILVADCVPIVLADKAGRVVACIHAGWRGTASNIVGRTVEACCALAGVRPDALCAALGPAIGPCCFRVGEEVAQTLARGCGVPVGAQDALVQREDAWYPDLWQLNRAHLFAAGLPQAQVEALRLCTFCSSDFFSYRRDGKLTGRHAAVVGLQL